MNHIYRVVWNAVSSTWTAVAETARGNTKSSKSGTTGTAVSRSRNLVAIGAMVLLPPFALAQVASVVVAPGTQLNAYVAPNGVTVVNINQANAAGLSHNRYNSFNVNPIGLILNNTTSAAQIAWQSQLAGQVTANFNQSSAARVILNEVVSNNRSTLAGFTEVLGGRADVVLANPYGITCSGCGFINTDRVTLSTGNPFLASNGGLGGFSVGQGDILITGTGLNATAQQVLDLVTRSVRIEAPINAQDLSIAAGTNKWSYDTRAVTGAATPTGNAPVYSIDTAVLGGMYANRIRLSSTEAGVGVRMLGDAAASASDFTLTAAGKVELQNRISAATDVNVSTTGTGAGALALTDASLTSTGALSLSSTGGTSIAGSALVAGTDLSVSAASLLDTASGAGIANNNLRHAGGALALAVGDTASLGATEWSAGGAWNGTFGNLVTTGATKLYSSGGTLIASAGNGDLALGLAALQSAGNMTLTASGKIGTAAGGALQSLGGNLALTSGNGLENAGTVSADKGAVTVRVDGAIANSGQIHAAQNLDIAGRNGLATASLANSGTLLTEQALLLKAAAVSNTAAGRVQAQTGSTVNAASMDNQGAWLLSQAAGASDNVTVTGTLANSGTLQGAGAVAVNAGQVDNSGTLLAVTDLAATTSKDFTNSGIAQAGGTLGVTGGGTVTNTGTGVLKAAALNLTAANGLNNAGIATADTGNATLRVDGTLTNSGQLHAKGNIDIADRTGGATEAIVNSGKLLAEQALALKAASFSNTAAGWTQAASGSTATLGALNNAGTWLLSQNAGATDQIAVSGAATNSGTLQSAGDLGVTAASLLNSGNMLAAGKIDATTTGDLGNAAGGVVQAGTALTLTAGNLASNAATGTMKGQSVAIQAGNGLANAGAIEASAGTATLRVNGTLNNSGTVHATNNIDIADRNGGATQILTNSGTLLADQAFAIKAANATNAATGRIQANTGSTVAVGAFDNKGTWILSQQGTAADSVTVTGTLANSGTLQSANDATLGANQIDNTGKLIATGNLTANVTAGLNNSGGTATVQAGRQLSVQGTGAALVTSANSKMLGDGLALNVASIDNAGTLQGGTRSDSTVNVANTLTNRTGGVLTVATAAAGAGSVAATTIANDGKIQSAGALTLGVGTGGLTSAGTVIAERDLALQSRSGNNYAATVNGLMQSRSGTLSVNGTGASTLSIGAAGTVVGQKLTAALGTVNLANGATLSSDRDMTLTLGTLALAGANSAVLGSTDQANPSQTRITTTSALTNNGLLFSGNDLAVTAPSLTNGLTGGIAALHDLNVTAAGGLTNRGALYAGNALTASAASGTLTNAATLSAYQGTISAGKSVTLSADTLVNNSTIDSNGAITIAARDLRNEVLGGDTRTYGTETTRVQTETGHDSQGYNGHGCCDQYESWYYKQTWYKDQTYAGGTPTIKPQITGAGAVSLTFNSGKNLGGVISGDVVTFSGSGSNPTFVNDDLALQRTSYTRTWTEETKYIAAGGETYYERRVINDNTTNAVTEISNIGAGVYARVLNTGTSFALTNNGSTAAQAADMKKGGAKTAAVSAVNGGNATKGTVGGAATGTTGAAAGSVTPVTTLNGRPAISFVAVNAANGVQGTSFGGINIPLPTNPNGLYVIAREPGAKYLVESNPRYQIGSSTVGSDYLAKLLGYDADTLVRRLGDSSYEAYLIKQQLIAQTGNSLLAGAKDAGTQVQALMDSAAGESKALGLVYGQALSPEQQAKLTHDIVWMVQTEIDGQVVLAPVVYLSPKTRNGLTQGAVITADTANLSLTSLTNSGGTIAGTQALTVVSVGDVTNTSGTIKGGNVAVSSTQGSIVNQTTASGSGGEQRYATDIGKTASIESTGTLSLDAAKNITNTGANVTAGGDASLKAGGDVTFDTIQNKSADTTHSSYNTAFSSGSTTTTTTTVTQVKSGLTSGGNLSIDAGKNITLAGTDTKAAGNADLKAGGDLNIIARENSKTTHTESNSAGMGMNNSLYGTTAVTTDSNSVRNVASTLQVGGNASLTAKNDITVQGSSVDVKGNGTVSATNVNVLAGRNYDETNTTVKQSGIMQVGASGSSSASAGAGAASASKSDHNGASASASAQASAQASGQGSAGLAFSADTTTTTQTTDLKHVGSSLGFGGNLTVNASNDVTLQGSSVNAGGNATVNAKNVNLLAAEDKSTSTTNVSTTRVGLMASTDNTAKAEAQAGASAAAGKGIPNAGAQASAGVSASTENHLDLVQKSDTTTSTLDTKNQGSSIGAGGNLGIKASDTLNVEGSKLASGADMKLDAKDMTFKAVDDRHEVSTSSSVTTAGLYASGSAKAGVEGGASAGLGAQAGVSAKAEASGEVGIYGSNTRGSTLDGSTTAQTSGISAGGSITRTATNNITDVGTQIEAGGNFTQSATTITSKAAANTTYSSSNTATDTAKLGVYAEASAEAGASASAGPGAGKPGGTSTDAGAGIRASYQHDDASEKSATSNAVVSNIKVGGNVSSTSSGATTMEGTNIAAGKDVTIGASSLDYTAARDTASSSSNSTSAGGSVSVDLVNKSAAVGVNYAGGTASGSSSTAVVGGITSGGNLSVTTTGDTRLEGTNLAAGGGASVTTGGKLDFAAAKNTSTSSSQDVGVDVAVSAGAKSGSASADVSYAKSTASSNEDVAGSIKSGSGPLTIKSGGDATFTGTTIASNSDVSVAAGGNLAFNAARSVSSSESLSVDVSAAASGGKKENVGGTTTGGKTTGGKTMDERSGEASVGVGYSKADSNIATGASITSNGGNIALSSGKNTSLEGTQVAATGAVGVTAGGKVTQTEAKSSSSSLGVDVGVSASGSSLQPEKKTGTGTGGSTGGTGGTSGTSGTGGTGGTSGTSGTSGTVGTGGTGSTTGTPAKDPLAQKKGSGVATASVETESSNTSQKTTLSGGQGVTVTQGTASPATRQITASVPMPDKLPAGKTVAATTASGAPLPTWLKLDPATGKFSGTPPADFKGELKVNVKVPQADGSVKNVPMTFSGN
ncbi:two-partner secretion domain-containing protein [Variovorax sp. IB41]|uniref:two-partner secretion domain-containing protein n=1 Tax=Variovorax sp. IB41 TaxID=2779370 RepID=UPI0018E7D18B|nr:hemagglutinin repeat-containing protein [Variovorax sp. IB41]MBJ2156563.1 hemagglutinin repeat-containing protein [Variovorax sp. IB41]